MSCEHEWDGAQSPRFQKCDKCGAKRADVQNINEGSLGRLYWDQEWQKRGVQENIYPATFRLIISQIKEGDRVVDIGCGTGSFVREYRKHFRVEQFNKRTVYGMDISEVAIRKTTEDVLEFYGYIGQFPEDAPMFFWRNFDIVVCTEFLEHATDDEKAANYLSKLIKADDDSTVFISVPDNMLAHDTEAEHQRVYTASTLDALLSRFFDYVQVVKVKEEQKLLAMCQQPKTMRV